MKSKILLIDDEELVVKSISKLLSKEGYEVLVSRSGDDAIDKASREVVDLIVCDVRMPGKNGVETIRRIREILKTMKRKPVREIFITGYAEEDIGREVESLQAADYLYKPFDTRDFLNCIKRNLEP